ncbi:hypothetical protein SARC_07737 [Sphaeroforma arctica JP610]|uniref:Nascent polypeptide-associated complex subunit alpha-like UBA domain-containing protein n=1 Tax=Sphaeroforma arctica JP610 TaxID=667725 RepID=A0A0L0FVB1_9EUKA|nr:hypothetical protein SARC_07737 [Sphaeroforma arctica JP610]KNC79883.1 hypothetical protein SARC_07737 [Sphaeroforma arctica JP610]|eukprot:XP_014153785.1 hypothetical protein SARC_07737 [Sphaeroforma arctica JP610]
MSKDENQNNGDDVDSDTEENQVVEHGHKSGKADLAKIKIERMVRDRKLALVKVEESDVELLKTELGIDEADAKLMLQREGGNAYKALSTFITAHNGTLTTC